MAWTITNKQRDAMTLTLDDGVRVNLPGGGSVIVNSGIAFIEYHGLRYPRVGIWPFPDNQNVEASYPGRQNIEIRNPQTAVTAIYHHEGP